MKILFHILVVEDDKNLRKLIVTYLKKSNYNTFEAENGQVALDVLDQNYIDLIISDIMMPEMDGYGLIKDLRSSFYDIPIMLITAKSEIEDKRTGFLLGADDYMVKPINMEEMILRIQVLLKRTKRNHEKIIKIGDVVLEYKNLSLRKREKEYHLAQKEFLLLYKLLSTPDTIFTRQELIEEIWGLDNESDYRTVDVHIKRIREKIRDIDEFEIQTVRGIGYKCILHKREEKDEGEKIKKEKFNTEKINY